MSHFSVLVIGSSVEEQLAPYHEFECTGKDDRFVQEVDVTEKARAEYDAHESTYYQDPEGVLHPQFTPEGEWDQRFWRDPTPEEEEKYRLGKAGVLDQRSGSRDGTEWYTTDWKDGRGYRAKVKCLPEGWREVEAKTSLVESFAKFAEDWYGGPPVPFGEVPDLLKKHKYGYILVDGAGNVAKVIDRTNPNSHWDWHQVGGRWNGFFKLKPNPKGAVGRGEPGLQRLNQDYRPPARDRADQCLKGDIDIEGMKGEAGQRAAKEYDKYSALTAGCPKPLAWEEVQKKHTENGETDWEKARNEYGEQPAVKALRSDHDAFWWDLDDFQCSRGEYIDRARANAIRTFAVVKDSQWFERGSMGWWGCVSDEKDEGEWSKQFSGLVDSLPDDTLLTVVDCHI